MRSILTAAALTTIGLSSIAFAISGGTLIANTTTVETVGPEEVAYYDLEVEGVGGPGTFLTITTSAPAGVVDTGSLGDSELAIYDPNGNLIQANDDYGPGVFSQLRFSGDAGQYLLPGTYTVQFTSYEANFTFNLNASTSTSDGSGATAALTVDASFDACPHGSRICADAESAFAEVNALDPNRISPAAPKTRHRPEVLTAELAKVRNTISNAGCIASPYQRPGYLATAGGTYATGQLLGGTSYGASIVTSAMTRSPKAFHATLDDSSAFGLNSSQYNKNREMLADFDGAGFFAGRWVRVRGTRGFWVALVGACNDGTSAAPSAAFRGPVTPWAGEPRPDTGGVGGPRDTGPRPPF